MRVAILGATSMLAADFVASALIGNSAYVFSLFARDPSKIAPALALRGVRDVPDVFALESFVDRGADEKWDAIINFVGVGDPAKAVAMGASILSVTQKWDQCVLSYLERHPKCRYIFMSSGAAFGLGVEDPVDRNTLSKFPLNELQSSFSYGVAKFYAEAVHRSQVHYSIIDVRIYNYFSRFADLDSRFFINEAIAAIRDGRVFGVDSREMWRDYLGEVDLANLLHCCLSAPPSYNGAIDAYSLAPISKTQVLALLKENFGLNFEISGGGINATGIKSHYYSLNRVASLLDFHPAFDSSTNIIESAKQILDGSALSIK